MIIFWINNNFKNWKSKNYKIFFLKTGHHCLLMVPPMMMEAGGQPTTSFDVWGSRSSSGSGGSKGQLCWFRRDLPPICSLQSTIPSRIQSRFRRNSRFFSGDGMEDSSSIFSTGFKRNIAISITKTRWREKRSAVMRRRSAMRLRWRIWWIGRGGGIGEVDGGGCRVSDVDLVSLEGSSWLSTSRLSSFFKFKYDFLLI